MMDNELKEKMNRLMYYLTKDAARSSFMEYIEEMDISFFPNNCFFANSFLM